MMTPFELAKDKQLLSLVAGGAASAYYPFPEDRVSVYLEAS